MQRACAAAAGGVGSYPCSAMSTGPEVQTLRERLDHLLVVDTHHLGRRLEGLRRARNAQRRAALLKAIRADLHDAETRAQRRAARQPQLAYPDELPISQARPEILTALRDHQVVVVAGETGSGKTTQLPKMLLELGFGRRGYVGHTQPRRIAARAVAERLSEEMQTELGDQVGYAVRFTDQVGQDSLVKLMTDGILVAEIRRDPLLLRYDAIVIDEAHERSLPIDFLLGYLHDLLPRRRDLKLVITSATIDPQRFARHFNDAPVLEVPGRTYPVEVRYRPVVDPDAPAGHPASDRDRDPMQALCEAVAEVIAEGPGDVLVFCSGEREIRDAADAVGDHLSARPAAGRDPVEIVPLYGRLSAGEQHRVFAAHSTRRVILATNVAETSLTVPGIRYVVDTGTARISRYSQRLKVQRLPIEPVSQASANQRAGRCGRTEDGICIRLYSEEDYLSRPRFTDPEILRTNLASVVLQMATLGLGEVASFGFVDPPDARAIRDGVQLLEELGALEPGVGAPDKRLTAIGRRLSRLPLDPRLARMVLEADRLGCVREVVVIAAALAIQDPRERPADARPQADASHARFSDPTSDLLGHLALWRYLREQQRELSSSRFRRMCRAEYLNYLRVREWQDLVAQLRRVLSELEITVSSTPDDPDRVHQALLAGLLSHLGLWQRDTRDYLGARGARFSVFPGSALARARPQWVMAGELVETSRLFARQVARIDPAWIEPLAGHLVKRSYAEPHWERKQAAAIALETVTLYGIPVVTGRRVQLGRVDPAQARELFVRHALVGGDWDTRHQFLRDNRRLLEEVTELEERTRRRDIVVDEETLVAFYDERVPAHVVSGRHFDSWWKSERRQRPDLLHFDRDLLLRPDATSVDPQEYPDDWTVGDRVLPLSYVFDPGTSVDGVTVDVPLPLLPQLRAEDFAWQVPGLRLDLLTALIRTLPKPLRRQLVPAPDHAARLMPALAARETGNGLLAALSEEILRSTGVVVPADAFDIDRIPAHLRVTFRVTDTDGRELATGKDLPALQDRLRQRLRASLTAVSTGVERTGMTSWQLTEPLPRTVTTTVAGHRVTGYPALVDEGTTVGVSVLESTAERDPAMLAGTVRLLRLTTTSPLAPVVRSLDNRAKLALSHQPYRSVPAMLEDCADCAAAHLVEQHGGPAWDADAFARLRDAVRADLVPATETVVGIVQHILSDTHTARSRLAELRSASLTAVRDDVAWQLDDLVGAGFVSAAGWQRLPDVARYLRGVLVRLERLADDPRRDLARLDELHGVLADYERALAAVPPSRRPPAPLMEVRWLIEELRLTLFAPSVRAAPGISATRIRRRLKEG